MDGLRGNLGVTVNYNGIDILDRNRLLDLLSVFVFRSHDERFVTSTDPCFRGADVKRLLLTKRRKECGRFFDNCRLRLASCGFSFRGIAVTFGYKTFLLRQTNRS